MRSHKNPPSPILGVLTLGMGLFVTAIGLGIVPVDPANVHAPMWVLAVCGLVFVIGGVAVLAHGRPGIQSAAGLTIVLAFGLVGGWVALFGDAAQMSGGIPFLPRALNVALGRGLFGIGAVLCFAFFAWGTARALRGET
ncbi:MAG: hypothetical protein AAGI52_08905 [Bacteroidota bacterium]